MQYQWCCTDTTAILNAANATKVHNGIQIKNSFSFLSLFFVKNCTYETLQLPYLTKSKTLMYTHMISAQVCTVIDSISHTVIYIFNHSNNLMITLLLANRHFLQAQNAAMARDRRRRIGSRVQWYFTYYSITIKNSQTSQRLMILCTSRRVLN